MYTEMGPAEAPTCRKMASSGHGGPRLTLPRIRAVSLSSVHAHHPEIGRCNHEQVMNGCQPATLLGLSEVGHMCFTCLMKPRREI